MSVPEDPNRILCYCLGVPYGVVEQAIREQGLKSVAEVSEATRAGAGCRSCHPEIRELIAEVKSQGKAGSTGLLGRLFGRGRDRSE